MPTYVERRGRVMAVIRRKGYRTKSATFDCLAEARTWAENIEANPIALERNYGADAGNGERTLADLAEWYQAHFSRRGRRDKTKLARCAWWVNRLGDVPLREMSPEIIREALRELRTTDALHGYPGGQKSLGRERSAATVNRYLAALSSMYRDASDDELAEWPEFDANPCHAVKRGKEGKGRTRWLKRHEYERLLRVCRKSEWDGLYLLVLLALKTGARKGELLPLRWHEVDLDRGRIHLSNTKNGEDRTLPLLPECIEELRQQRARVTATLTDVHELPEVMVFPPRQAGGTIVNIYGPWYAALRAARIEDFTFHGLRHTCASHLSQAGNNTLTVASVLGHKTLAMAQRYAHQNTENNEAALLRAFGGDD